MNLWSGRLTVCLPGGGVRTTQNIPRAANHANGNRDNPTTCMSWRQLLMAFGAANGRRTGRRITTGHQSQPNDEVVALPPATECSMCMLGHFRLLCGPKCTTNSLAVPQLCSQCLLIPPKPTTTSHDPFPRKAM